MRLIRIIIGILNVFIAIHTFITYYSFFLLEVASDGYVTIELGWIVISFFFLVGAFFQFALIHRTVLSRYGSVIYLAGLLYYILTREVTGLGSYIPLMMLISALVLWFPTAIRVSDVDIPEETTEDSPVKSSDTIRFPRLKSIDLEKGDMSSYIPMPQEDMIGLKAIIKRFVDYAAYELNLYYDPRTVRIFFSSLAASNLIILEGISGTGKTSLPYAFGRFFNNDATLIPVQPAWREKSDLIGYLNEFTGRFNETQFLSAIYQAAYNKTVNFIILDEMNLSRVEYYFADFLSMLEIPDRSKWLIGVVSIHEESDPTLFDRGTLLVPDNLWFIGTVNKDDSTFTISDKVYDRAMPIEINGKATFVDSGPTMPMNIRMAYLRNLFDEAILHNEVNRQFLDKIQTLDRYLSDTFKLTFGNRIINQINTFIPVYVACGGDALDGLDYIIRHKILRKLEQFNIPFIRQELTDLIKIINTVFGRDVMKTSIEFLQWLLK